MITCGINASDIPNEERAAGAKKGYYPERIKFPAEAYKYALVTSTKLGNGTIDLSLSKPNGLEGILKHSGSETEFYVQKNGNDIWRFNCTVANFFSYIMGNSPLDWKNSGFNLESFDNPISVSGESFISSCEQDGGVHKTWCNVGSCKLNSFHFARNGILLNENVQKSILKKLKDTPPYLGLQRVIFNKKYENKFSWEFGFSFWSSELGDHIRQGNYNLVLQTELNDPTLIDWDRKNICKHEVPAAPKALVKVGEKMQEKKPEKKPGNGGIVISMFPFGQMANLPW